MDLIQLADFAQQIGCSAIHLDINCLDEELIEDAHQRGLKVRVYTVDQLADMKKMQALGVDGIFTNFPSRALAYFQQIATTA